MFRSCQNITAGYKTALLEPIEQNPLNLLFSIYLTSAFQKLGLWLLARAWVQKHQSKQITVKVTATLHPSWMATAYFALPFKSVSLQPFLEGDCYKSQEVSRQNRTKRLLYPNPFFFFF